MAIEVYKVRNKALEDVIDVLVPAAPAVPCFNDSLVVTMNEQGNARFNKEEKSAGKEFEAHHFRLSNVTPVGVPS